MRTQQGRQGGRLRAWAAVLALPPAAALAANVYLSGFIDLPVFVVVFGLAWVFALVVCAAVLACRGGDVAVWLSGLVGLPCGISAGGAAAHLLGLSDGGVVDPLNGYVLGFAAVWWLASTVALIAWKTTALVASSRRRHRSSRTDDQGVVATR